MRRTPKRAELSEHRRSESESIVLTSKPIVVDVVAQRQAKFGPHPADSLQAAFDIRFCMAVAWHAGAWTHRLGTTLLQDRRVRETRDRIAVVTEEGWVGNEVRCSFHFQDGTVEIEEVSAFLGSAENPMSNTDLCNKFAESARDESLSEKWIQRILDVTCSISEAQTVGPLMQLIKSVDVGSNAMSKIEEGRIKI